LRKYIILTLFFTLILVSTVSAQEAGTYISNSANWQDVYSVMQFAAVNGKTGYFLVSTRHSTLLINQLDKNTNYLVVSSSDNPFVVGYEAILESKDFTDVNEIRTRNVNLEMAGRLPNEINSFVVLDDSYGYNAISVAPYAALSDSYVIFANRRNINQVYNLLSTRNPDSIIIYGQVDREVKTRLEEFNPEVINEGDRFLNNQIIVDRYQALYEQKNGEPKRQAILTNGEFIEQEIMSGVEPVVFIGRANVPDQVADYIRESDIDIGILIGNELIGTATFIRRQLGISVFVKFAQSARAPSSTISPVEDLDRFYLPRYTLDLDIFEARYNQLSNQIEITYWNRVDLSTYLKGTITVRYDGGTQILGDEEAVFIDKLQFKTLIYDKKSDGEPLDAMQGGNITAEIFTLFGESPRSLEYTLRKTIEVDTVSILDNSKIEFGRILFDKRSGKFLIEIINTGDVDVFVDLELIDLLINDELITLGADELIFVEAGESKFIEVTTDMDEEDLNNNPRIRIRAYYGERERSLVKVLEGEFTYNYTGFWYNLGEFFKQLLRGILLYLPLIIIVILLILIVGMKKKCPHCKEINNLRAKHCKKCGHKI
jgi:hypothetical protein